jgi:hypothetical protein
MSASTIHFFARPHIVSWLFLWLWFAVLDRWETNRTSLHAIYWLPLLMILWVNLHGGFLLGLAVAGCFWIGVLVETIKLSDAFARVVAHQRARILGIVLMLSMGATLINPYGYRLHEHIYRYLTNRFLMNHIDEFLSPDFHGAAQKCFAAIVLLALVTLARSPRRLRVSQLLVLLLAVYAGLYASRNLPVAAILLVLVIGPPLSDVLKDLWQRVMKPFARVNSFSARVSMLDARLRGHVWPMVTLVAMFAICFAGGRLGGRQVVHAQFDAARFPVETAEMIAKSGSREPIFCPDSWGGYLIYRLSPQVKVVVDDRHDLYGEVLLSKYLTLVRVEPGWNRILDEWNVRRVLMPAGSALANILRETPQWHVTHEDKTAMLFERDSNGAGIP